MFDLKVTEVPLRWRTVASEERGGGRSFRQGPGSA